MLRLQKFDCFCRQFALWGEKPPNAPGVPQHHSSCASTPACRARATQPRRSQHFVRAGYEPASAAAQIGVDRRRKWISSALASQHAPAPRNHPGENRGYVDLARHRTPPNREKPPTRPQRHGEMRPNSGYAEHQRKSESPPAGYPPMMMKGPGCADQVDRPKTSSSAAGKTCAWRKPIGWRKTSKPRGRTREA